MPFSEFIIVIQVERFAIVIGNMIVLACYVILPVFLIEPSHLHRYVWKLFEECHFFVAV